MRVMFFGTSAFAVPSLEQLVRSGRTIVACVTQPDRPQGRGLSLEPSPVKRAALQFGLPLLQPERLHASLFDGRHADIGVVLAYGALIPRELLELPTHGMLGVHPSLLPKYRGAAPIAHALLNGETSTGVTIFRLNEALDAGDIVLQEPAAIAPEETAETLAQRLAQLGAAALVRALGSIAEGRAVFTPQDGSQASLAPKLTKAEGCIDWRHPAEAIARQVRATVPWPGAVTSWQGAWLKISSAAVDEKSRAVTVPSPGTVVRVEAEAIAVATGRGVLLVKELQPANRRRMQVRDFLAGHPVHVGDQFGEAGGVRQGAR